MNEVEQFLSESQGDVYPSMKFQKLSDFVKGTIIETRIDKRESRFRPGEIETSLLVSLEVNEARGVMGVKVDDARAQEQPINCGDRVTVWVKRGFMAAAVSEAVREAGVKTLAEGGVFTIAFTEEKDTGKGNPAKVYRASYKPPAHKHEDTAPQDFDEIPF
jgi:hypothetical protein